MNAASPPRRRLFAPIVLLAVFAAARGLHGSEPASPPTGWWQGNTHTHTINSDGDASPDAVARWYKEHGYNFLFITDHESITRVDGLNALLGSDNFIVLPGEEVTSNFEAPLLRVHVNTLNPRTRATARKGANPRETLQFDLAAAQATGGIVQINHPNFYWQLTADDIAASHGATLLEISNMHPLHNNFGAGPAAPGTEEIWDRVLTQGIVLWGVASDDLHRLHTESLSTADLALEAKPGQGWIMVRAEKLDAAAIMDAIRRGDFYASTGVELKTLAATPAEIALEIEPEPRNPVKYTIAFIGAGGRVLETIFDTRAAYRPRGDEGYVRVRVTDSNGHHAWTQPAILPRQH